MTQEEQIENYHVQKKKLTRRSKRHFFQWLCLKNLQKNKNHCIIETCFLVFVYEFYFILLMIFDFTLAFGATILICLVIENPCKYYTYNNNTIDIENQ